MGILREFGRITAMIIGLIGSAIALVIVLAWEAFHLTSVLVGGTTDSSSRTGWGLLLVGIAALASILALFLDRISSILFLIAGIGLFWVISGWAVIPLIFFLIAAFFAWLDRSPSRG
ncbi:MAG TPA: hypothetical protein VHR15_10200 [Ktedonobacterales bacterium]|jgi:hypothetical protein|nr:hypothetical protein [Ktedonobacterales bacterium]